jgi:xanthine dehydrogenase accessory factor
MRQLRDAVSAWCKTGRRIAGATLVRSDGSTPHQLGLALATVDSGETVGALSGGCVDADIVLACDRVLAGGPAELLRFGADDEGTSALVCGGAITVWVHELAPAVAEAIDGVMDAVVLTRKVGQNIEQSAITLTHAKDYECGNSVADPAHEVAARWLLVSRQRTELLQLPDGGEMFLEAFGRRRLFVVVGSSGYTEALCAQAALLGYETVVVEPRPRFAAGITFADEVIGSWPDVALEKLTEDGRLDERSAVVVCTHDPKFDEPALMTALSTPAGFIGALGSRTTSAERLARLRSRGIPETALERVKAPVGLDLGGASPAETAVSVTAHIIATARGRSGAPLRETSGPLHAR